MDILSAFFSYQSPSVVVTGAAVYVVHAEWYHVYGCSLLPVRNHPPTEWAAGCPEECVWVDLETQADHITHEPWQHSLCVNNSSPLSVGSSTGQRLEYSSLAYAWCRDPGGITEYCYKNTVGYSMFPLQES